MQISLKNGKLKIGFYIGEGKRPSKVISKRRFTTDKADWEGFSREINPMFYNKEKIDMNDLEGRTEQIMQLLKSAADRTIPRKRLPT